MSRAGLLDPPADPYPPSLTIGLEKVDTLRYGENPHQPAARYRRPGSTAADGPFATGEPPLQGKALSYNNVLDAAAAAALGRALRGPGCVIVKHTNPCGAAERLSLLEAWEAALAGDPVSAFGGVVALTRPVDAAVAEALVSIFLEVVVAPGFDDDALAILATKPNLRLVVDPFLAVDEPLPAPDPTGGSIRSAGGAVLVSAPDTVADDPTTWTCGHPAGPDRPRSARSRPRLAAGPWRHLERDRARPRPAADRDGVAARPRGSTRRAGPSRRHAPYAGAASTVGASCASDAFYPFADAVEVCLAAGVTRVRPAGRFGARRGGRGRRRRGRRHDADDRDAALPPLMGRRGRRRSTMRPWHIPMSGRDPDEAHRAATPLELLFDLCFVVAVAQAASFLHHDLAEGQVAHGVLSYLVVFFAIWWPWMNFTWFASAYDTDDVAVPAADVRPDRRRPGRRGRRAARLRGASTSGSWSSAT